MLFELNNFELAEIPGEGFQDGFVADENEGKLVGVDILSGGLLDIFEGDRFDVVEVSFEIIFGQALVLDKDHLLEDLGAGLEAEDEFVFQGFLGAGEFLPADRLVADQFKLFDDFLDRFAGALGFGLAVTEEKAPKFRE